jgi:predicted Zn-dependent protease
LWVHDLQAGATDPRSGDLSVVVSDGQWLEPGRPPVPVTGLTLVGNIVELLQRVDRVCGDRAADSGAAVCGREDAGVPIGLLAPTFRTAGLRELGS